jgi:predicted RNA-binding protein with RPS1 domain/Tfp pilus assembly protein PilF
VCVCVSPQKKKKQLNLCCTRVLGNGRVALSLKRSVVENVKRLQFKDLRRGRFVVGRVTRIDKFGLFIKLDFSDNLTGLCHVRNITDTDKLTHDQLKEKFHLGQTLRALIFKVDASKKRFSLALKPSLIKTAERNERLRRGETQTSNSDSSNDDDDDDDDDEDDDDDDDEDDDEDDDDNSSNDDDDDNSSDDDEEEEDDDDSDDMSDDSSTNIRLDKASSDSSDDASESDEDLKIDESALDRLLKRTEPTFNEKERAELLAASGGKRRRTDAPVPKVGAAFAWPSSGDKSSSGGVAAHNNNGDDESDVDSDDTSSSASSDDDQAQQANNDFENDNDDSDDDDENDNDDSDDDAKASKQNGNDGARVNKQASERRREEWVASREDALMNDGAEPDSEAGHERRVVSQPSSARAWIAYMAFHAAAGALAAARRVVDRALQTIPVVAERARLDVWLALLNLELAYGTQASLSDAFQRAAQKNDAETVHLKMAELYAAADRPRDAESAYTTMCKKFVGSVRVYLAYARFLVDQGNVAAFRKLLDRAVTALPSREHLSIVSKFAQLEYQRGSVERGRTLFEGVLATHPKRLDQWHVYADMEVKHGDASAARYVALVALCPTRLSHSLSCVCVCVYSRVYERISTLKLSSKKMKSVLKRWLAFETTNGTAAQQEHVRQKARDYVATFTNTASN